MSRYLQPKITVRQKVKIAPALIYSSIGIAFAGVVSLIMFLYSNFGNSASAFASADEVSTTAISFEVNLAGKPDGFFLTPEIERKGKCCNAVDSDNCIEFSVTLDKNAEGIKFEIASGELPVGSLYYYIDCENPVEVGQPVCLSGTHKISFCKPGNALNSYRITSFSRAEFPKDTSVRIGGPAIILKTDGLLSSSVNWKSIAPGYEGQFNSCLSNTNGSMISFLSNPNCPAYIDYAVSGTHLSACGNTQTVTDTVRVIIFPAINIQFIPASAIIPAGGSLNLNATVTGGKGKFNYQWFNEKNQSVGYDSALSISTEGNYTVIVKDEMSETMSSVTKTISVKQSNCYQPTGFTINNIGASTLKIGWEANETVYGFKIRKRVVGEKNWSSSGTILPYNNRTLTNLIDNTPYEIQIQTVCDPMHNDTSNWSQIYSFKTKSFCNNPDSVKIISVGDTSAQLKWSVTDNAIIYKIRLRKVGDTTWILKNQSASFPCYKKLKGLEQNTTYELQMQNECYWKSGTEFTKSISFTTASAKTTEIIPAEIKPEDIGKFSIIPNPSSGIFELDLTTGDNNTYQLSIVNLIGAKVYEASVTATNGIISKSISLSNFLPKGIYLITVSNGDIKYIKRLLLSK
ncbi:hypothetical protein LBMAG27_05700 [Bacteroidota bacterium]|nr:hypothetical protein LBMAG27_05700 [Bacteroidota bacterium]